MTRYDATHQQERTARHNLLNRLRALESATAEQIASISAGHSPSLKGINRRWLAVDEAVDIHRACLQAVDRAVLEDAS